MNYIKNLENENAQKAAYISGLVQGLNDIRYYLSLPKFEQDIMVNKNDIFDRIQNAFNLAERRMDDIKNV